MENPVSCSRARTISNDDVGGVCARTGGKKRLVRVGDIFGGDDPARRLRVR